MSTQPAKKLTEQMTTTIAIVLFEYGPHIRRNAALERKGPVSANFLARSACQLQAIRQLAKSDHTASGWQLYRSLLERYLLYWHLCRHDEFDVFDDWCFRKYFEYENRLRSSMDLNTKPEMQDRDFVRKGKERYEKVSNDPRVRSWRRPDPEDVTKSMDMKFLYDAGYDHASGFVHPMSIDGLNDYYRLVGKSDYVQDEGAETLLKNSHLIVSMHIQDFLNQPELRWGAVLYDTVDAMRASLVSPDVDVDTPFGKVLTLNLQQIPLAQKFEDS